MEHDIPRLAIEWAPLWVTTLIVATALWFAGPLLRALLRPKMLFVLLVLTVVAFIDVALLQQVNAAPWVKVIIGMVVFVIVGDLFIQRRKKEY